MWRAPIPHLSLFDRKVEQGLIVFTAGRAFLKKIKHLVVGVSGKRALGKNYDRVVGGMGRIGRMRLRGKHQRTPFGDAGVFNFL